ncbi:hypothetical protein QY049_28595 [Bradyrhizobium sp. WYCCWR 13022]|uniref:hypothetical protein n=1 Tax=unclassified Bradyrhizobium TaxID=2631580 RepID=UPI00263B0807|nr:hypothetical protein [Bradyrhizobium sp. WYCCWR 13022]MDN4987125.1 hypothetical protein [Bradyrhizobium sp. WYCCWR 13022]
MRPTTAPADNVVDVNALLQPATATEHPSCYDIVLNPRGRGRWKWAVRRAGGEILMSGSECSRAAARYKAERALFLLLSASASRAASIGGKAPDWL